MRQILAVVRYNFRDFFKNPKVILTFLLGFVLCFLLSTRVVEVIEQYQTSVQAAEPFLWTFGDITAVLLSSLLMLLLFSDLPKLSPASPYCLIRITKKKWLAGQLIYVVCAAAMYTAFLLIATIILCISSSYAANVWSETAAMLAYSEMGEKLSVPSTVKVMESIRPFGCMLQVITLQFFYILSLSFIILAGNLVSGKNGGMLLGLLYSGFGFLLEPKVLAAILGLHERELYKVNVLIAWISPLSHAVYGRHNFGYDRLPSVGQSCIVFFLILLGLAVISFQSLKRYHFNFLGEKS